MPYNPSTGIYTLPAVYLAIPGTTIIAAQHNTPLVDLQTANNYARPIRAGGTAATTAAGARTSLAVPGLATANVFTARNSWAYGGDIASTTEIVPTAAGNYFRITGSNTISSIEGIAPGMVLLLEFSATLILVHGVSDIVLPGGANIVTQAGDTAIFVQENTTRWRCITYQQNIAPVVTLSGVWTPTVALGTNAAVVAAVGNGMYTRVDDIVSCAVQLTCDPTASATPTDFFVTLPVASAFSDITQLTGSGGTDRGEVAYILGVTATHRASVRYTPSTTSVSTFYVTFTYQVI